MISKPQSDEYSSFHNTYISKVPDGDVLLLLEQLKETTSSLFSNLSKDKANYATQKVNGQLRKFWGT